MRILFFKLKYSFLPETPLGRHGFIIDEFYCDRSRRCITHGEASELERMEHGIRGKGIPGFSRTVYQCSALVAFEKPGFDIRLQCATDGVPVYLQGICQASFGGEFRLIRQVGDQFSRTFMKNFMQSASVARVQVPEIFRRNFFNRHFFIFEVYLLYQMFRFVLIISENMRIVKGKKKVF